MVTRPTTATPAGRQRLCTVKPSRCALRAMPAASRTMVQSTHSASSHASPSAGNAASTKGKTAQCAAQASDAHMPARSKTATDFTSHCSMSFQFLSTGTWDMTQPLVALQLSNHASRPRRYPSHSLRCITGLTGTKQNTEAQRHSGDCEFCHAYYRPPLHLLDWQLAARGDTVAQRAIRSTTGASGCTAVM
jgi:hypothetical protein